jgi:hypothetical protein
VDAGTPRRAVSFFARGEMAGVPCRFRARGAALVPGIDVSSLWAAFRRHVPAKRAPNRGFGPELDPVSVGEPPKLPNRRTFAPVREVPGVESATVAGERAPGAAAAEGERAALARPAVNLAASDSSRPRRAADAGTQKAFLVWGRPDG